MIFMDCGSCVRVEVLANPLSSEDSEQDGKDVSEPEAASTAKDLLQLLFLHQTTAEVRPAHLLESSSQLKPVTCNK